MHVSKYTNYERIKQIREKKRKLQSFEISHKQILLL